MVTRPRRRYPVLSTVVLALLGATGGAVASEYHPAIRSALFPLPAALEPNVGFWRDVYSRHSSSQVAIHDERHLGAVYEVVDLSDIDRRQWSEGKRRRERRKRVRAVEEKYRALLRRLARTPDLDSPEADHVRRLLADLPGGARKYRDASWRVRSQTGQRDRFEAAVVVSGRFVPAIEEILKREGVPIEVAVMPFVESMFNYEARSKVGASGAWQFTYATGRHYLNIDSAVDERSDVLLAAAAAARKLRQDYERLRSWPLALTAYNHGSAGMARAVKQLGTRDIGVISQRYRSRSFGFASRNFYAEFLAALIVHRERESHFPDVEPDPPLRFDEFAAAQYVSLRELATRAGVDLETLRPLNPALKRNVLDGSLLLPKGYPLRIPAGRLVDFQQAYAEVPAEHKRSRQLVTGYRVRRGDTLGTIARRFGTSVTAIQHANGLPRADRIYVGQYLQIPDGRRRSRTPPPAVASGPRPAAVHVVRRGDTLARIARRYGATESELVAANALRSADLIYPGQHIRVPGIGVTDASPSGSGTHVVRRGDTLFRIAVLYGTSVDAIISLNRLRSTLIQVGQVLRIPD